MGKRAKGQLLLPHSVQVQSKALKFMVFATVSYLMNSSHLLKGEQAEVAKKLGASIVGGDDLIERVFFSQIREFIVCLGDQWRRN